MLWNISRKKNTHNKHDFYKIKICIKFLLLRGSTKPNNASAEPRGDTVWLNTIAIEYRLRDQPRWGIVQRIKGNQNLVSDSLGQHSQQKILTPLKLGRLWASSSRNRAHADKPKKSLITFNPPLNQILGMNRTDHLSYSLELSIVNFKTNRSAGCVG